MPIENFTGKTAVVTGGASGIGFAMARMLGDLGANVMIADLAGDRLDRAADRLAMPAVPTDVADEQAVQRLADEAVARFGTVHLICNNAGAGTHLALEQLSMQDWRWTMDVNFWGVVNGIRAFLPILRANPEGGHVLNTLSVLAVQGRPGGAAYCASKYAALGVTECLAAEEKLIGSGVGVTAFCPGPVATEIAASAGRRARRYGAATLPPPADDKVRQFFESGERIEHMASSVAAKIALDAVREDRFWALTHPELMDGYRHRHEGLAAAMRAAKP